MRGGCVEKGAASKPRAAHRLLGGCEGLKCMVRLKGMGWLEDKG